MLSQKAKEFVLIKHKDLRRISKSSQPMIEHIAEVVDLLQTATSDDEIISAAWLHDTVEDTDTTLEDIESLFGKRVSLIVDGLTDPIHFSSLPVTERKAAQAERILTKDRDVRLVKLCDQISNILSVTNDTPPDWDLQQQWSYIEGAARIARLCSGISAHLDRRFEESYLYADSYYRNKLCSKNK